MQSSHSEIKEMTLGAERQPRKYRYLPLDVLAYLSEFCDPASAVHYFSVNKYHAAIFKSKEAGHIKALMNLLCKRYLYLPMYKMNAIDSVFPINIQDLKNAGICNYSAFIQVALYIHKRINQKIEEGYGLNKKLAAFMLNRGETFVSLSSLVGHFITQYCHVEGCIFPDPLKISLILADQRVKMAMLSMHFIKRKCYQTLKILFQQSFITPQGIKEIVKQIGSPFHFSNEILTDDAINQLFVEILDKKIFSIIEEQAIFNTIIDYIVKDYERALINNPKIYLQRSICLERAPLFRLANRALLNGLVEVLKENPGLAKNALKLRPFNELLPLYEKQSRPSVSSIQRSLAALGAGLAMMIFRTSSQLFSILRNLSLTVLKLFGTLFKCFYDLIKDRKNLIANLTENVKMIIREMATTLVLVVSMPVVPFIAFIQSASFGWFFGSPLGGEGYRLFAFIENMQKITFSTVQHEIDKYDKRHPPACLTSSNERIHDALAKQPIREDKSPEHALTHYERSPAMISALSQGQFSSVNRSIGISRAEEEQGIFSLQTVLRSTRSLDDI